MKNEKYTAGGYLFEDEESLKEARNELEGVEYLKKRTNYKNPKSILNIYNTVIEKKLFKTAAGLSPGERRNRWRSDYADSRKTDNGKKRKEIFDSEDKKKHR